MRHRSTLLTAIPILLYAGLFSPLDGRSQAFAHEVHDEDLARDALENGEILSLDGVIADLKEAVPGEISEVELEKENGLWIYEFKVISPEGRMLYVRVDAKTGRLIGKTGG